MKFQEIPKEKSTLYKGIAILMIAIHNFMHLLPGPRELEFSFKQDEFFIFLNSSLQSPEMIVQFLFSFFGHFGVQLFIFLSAYGLTKKYLQKRPDYWPFIGKRFLAIYPSFFIAILLWAIVMEPFESGPLGPLMFLYENANSLLLKISLLSNFYADERLNLVGPWWFISFIFQFYFVFPVLFSLDKKWGTKALVSLSLATITLTILSHGELAGINLYYTVIGHIPELCLGLYFAKQGNRAITVPNGILLLALGVFIMGNLFEPLWYLTHLSFLLLLLAGLNTLFAQRSSSSRLIRIFVFFGSISMPLFLVNGFLRQPFVNYAYSVDQWFMTLCFCFISLTISTLFALFLAKVERVLRRTLPILK